MIQLISIVTVLGKLDVESVLFRCGMWAHCCNPGGNGTSCCPNGIDGNIFSLQQQPAMVQNGSNFAPGYTMAPITDLATATAPASSFAPTQNPLPGSSCPTTTPLASGNHKTFSVGLGVGLGVGIPLLAALLGAVSLLLRERHVVGRLHGAAPPRNAYG